MSKGKDKEDTLIKKLDKLEEAGKQRERSGLDEILGGGADAEHDEEPPFVPASGDDTFLQGFDEKVEELRVRFQPAVLDPPHEMFQFLPLFL